MDQNSAINLITDTFNHPFNEEKFSNFSVNLFDEINQSDGIFWQNNKNLPSGIQDKVIEYKVFGNLEIEDNNNIIVAMAKLKSAKIVEKSRYVQRDLAKFLLDNNNADACLISFFADNYDDWRFSYVRIDYKREISEKGKIKIKQTVSPLKRYSYLVGKNEPNHTAKSQIAPLLYDKKKISLDEIEKAF